MYKRGDIVVIPVPFSDLSSSKIRPVLIISSDEYNELTDDIIVMAITSNITSKKYCVHITETEEGELPEKSQIRTDKVYTLAKSIIKKKICGVTENTLTIAVDLFNEVIR